MVKKPEETGRKQAGSDPPGEEGEKATEEQWSENVPKAA